uniref:CSON009759 protein n=1 Tax=Culicoides sonorensis TaxID=179676 RepID=A0A336M0K9_CULSO
MALKPEETFLHFQQSSKNIPSRNSDTKIVKSSKKSLTLVRYRRCKLSPSSSPIMLVMLFHYVLILLLAVNQCSCFVLDGTQNSFAQFRKWYTGLNGTLEIEFKTEQPNGLVMYTDDGGTYDFFELKLVEGALRLRYNLGGGAQIITVGRDLHDGHWHKVQLQCHNRPGMPIQVESIEIDLISVNKENLFKMKKKPPTSLNNRGNMENKTFYIMKHEYLRVSF